MILRTLRVPPVEPPLSKQITIDGTTTTRQLVFKTMFGANRLTFPAAALMIGERLGQGLVPVIMGRAIDQALATQDLDQLLWWIAALVGTFLLLTFSFRYGVRLEILATQSVRHQLRQRVAARALDPRGGAENLPGVSLSIYTSDVYQLSRIIAVTVNPVADLFAVFFTAAVLLPISWQLALLVLIGVPLMVLALDRIGQPLRRRSRISQSLVADASGSATDLVTGFRVLKGIHAEPVAADRYREVSQRALTATLKTKSSNGVFLASSSLITQLFIVAVSLLAGWMALTGRLSVGELITVVGVTQYVIGPMRAFAGNFGTLWASAMASSGRVLSLLQAPPSLVSGDGQLADRAVQRLDLVDVTDGPLDEFSLAIEPGECVGVLADGQTAKALEEVLSLRRPVDHGRLTLDGVDVLAVPRDAAVAHLLVAPHAADLFDGSLINNVTVSDPIGSGALTPYVAAALTAAACDDVIENLPGGLDAPVGEGGRRLSGGQRQRIALARALAADPPILVLHEPTTAVDSVTEALIAERLRPIREQRSTMIITSSPALLAVTDRVVLIKDGKIAAMGRHHDLMNDPGYAEVFE